MENFYFQQYNDPKHTFKIVQKSLLYNTWHMLHTGPLNLDIYERKSAVN